MSTTMETPSISKNYLLFIFLVTLSFSSNALPHGNDDFLRCLLLRSKNATVYTRNDTSYLSILQSSIQNMRFTSPSTPKPLLIITPTHESQIQAVVLCSKQHGIQVRTRSGGHDYEGLSCSSRVPFVIIDLVNMNGITIDVERKTAFVQAGATLGQLYYEINRKSKTLAFPAGECPTVGVGGHFSGGGYGPLTRKHGLAVDNIIGARLIDVNGNILDRKSMGDELFWAIRGGGAASFGVVTAWELKLVTVPETVTVFSIDRTLEQNATELIHRWQYVAPNLPSDVMLAVFIEKVNASKTGEKTIQARFVSVFLGRADGLLELLVKNFPELGVERGDCKEVSWIQSALFLVGFPIGTSPEVLASRISLVKPYFKAKSDYVQVPIPKQGLEGIWKLLYEKEVNSMDIILSPYGGRMNEISESATPFPHRRGNLYGIQYMVFWDKSGAKASKPCINWIRKLYKYMTPYVSKSPRAAYVNYRDLDLGVTTIEGKTSYEEASSWGLKYFKNNFDRLVHVKTVVDPNNFFRNEQSIPPVYSQKRTTDE